MFLKKSRLDELRLKDTWASRRSKVDARTLLNISQSPCDRTEIKANSNYETSTKEQFQNYFLPVPGTPAVLKLCQKWVYFVVLRIFCEMLKIQLTHCYRYRYNLLLLKYFFKT